MKKKYASVNLKTYEKSHYDIIKKHNEDRKNFDKKISYLLSKENITSPNFHQEFNNLEELETKRINLLNEKNKGDYQKKHLVEFVVSLSYEQVKQYEEQNIDINKGFLNYAKNLEKDYNFNILEVDIHHDEGYLDEDVVVQKNLHAHILAHNFDFEKGQAIASNLRKSDYRNLQTLAQKSFEEVDLEFERGVSKFVTKKEHLSKDDYVKAKKQKELFAIFHELSASKKELKATYTDLNKQKNQVKEERNKFKKDSELYKEFNNKFLELQKLEKEKREEYRLLTQKIETQKLEIDFFKKQEDEAREEIKKILLEHTKKVKPLIGDEYIKIENRNEMYSELVKVANKNFKFQNVENESLKKQVETLQNQLTQLKNNNLEEHELLQKAIKAFEIKQEENKEQALKIEKLEERNKLMMQIMKNKNIKFSDFKNEYNNQSLKNQTISLLKNL